MPVARGCEAPSIMRLEFDVYVGTDVSQPYLWVAMDMQCPSDDFERSREAFKAVQRHISAQLRAEQRCPYHPLNQLEGMADAYWGA